MPDSDVTLAALTGTALATAVLHTIAGPDHYLPFIAIARSRKFSLMRALFWTLVCGIGHVGSALALAAAFLLFAKFISEARLEWLEEWRGDIAAWALILMGAGIFLHALYCRWKNKPRVHRHVHLDGTVTVHTHGAVQEHPHDGLGSESHECGEPDPGAQEAVRRSFNILSLCIFLVGGLLCLLPLIFLEKQAEENGGNGQNILSWALFGLGAAVIVYGFYDHWRRRPHRHKHVHADGTVTVHTHDAGHDHSHSDEKGLSFWVIFIIFVLGPCEALLPILTASAVLGAASVVLIAIVFSVATIMTMMTAVALGVLGLNVLRFDFLERFAPEIAGITVMLCGIAIAFLGL